MALFLIALLAIAQAALLNRDGVLQRVQDLQKSGKFCEDGWLRYDESCYHIDSFEKLSLKKAEQRCLDRGATLFVPNSYDEFNTVLENTPKSFWTWVGIYKNNEQNEPQWHLSDGIQFTRLNWLLKPFQSGLNGWTAISQCAAHFNSITATKYVYFYPCDYEFYYICEKNYTISAQSQPALAHTVNFHL